MSRDCCFDVASTNIAMFLTVVAVVKFWEYYFVILTGHAKFNANMHAYTSYLWVVIFCKRFSAVFLKNKDFPNLLCLKLNLKLNLLETICSLNVKFSGATHFNRCMQISVIITQFTFIQLQVYLSFIKIYIDQFSFVLKKQKIKIQLII
eukprot:TRINITY_DN14804_c0_g1_i2.p2 TRINITY_DN14804_c0_g1~~TRINITY_DN14804_c0_g1_i2.p2  ORF type:complete len:149 (-),score=0.96 TRINITY_DN14804_c0_g1_i2:45-491(-)